MLWLMWVISFCSDYMLESISESTKWNKSNEENLIMMTVRNHCEIKKCSLEVIDLSCYIFSNGKPEPYSSGLSMVCSTKSSSLLTQLKAGLLCNLAWSTENKPAEMYSALLSALLHNMPHLPEDRPLRSPLHQWPVDGLRETAPAYWCSPPAEENAKLLTILCFENNVWLISFNTATLKQYSTDDFYFLHSYLFCSFMGGFVWNGLEKVNFTSIKHSCGSARLQKGTKINMHDDVKSLSGLSIHPLLQKHIYI